MNNCSPVGLIVLSMLAIAALYTLKFEDGWLIWIPVVLSLVIVANFLSSLGR